MPDTWRLLRNKPSRGTGLSRFPFLFEVALKRYWNMLVLQNRGWRQHVPLILFVVMLLIFTGYASLFALRTQRVTIPDEHVHFGLSKQYATSWGIPPDAPDTYQFGQIQRQPFLYYWLNGRLINGIKLFFPVISDWKLLIALRLVNVVYSVLGVIFCFLLALQVMKNRWWALLVVFFLTNTLMLVFLSGGINYDNLANLCSFAAIYYLVRVWNGKDFTLNSLAWLIWILAGTLVKISILPLAVALFIAWVFYIVKNRNTNILQFPPGWKTTGLFIIFLAFFSLNASLYAVNLIKYRAIIPSCTKVLTEEQCNKNAVVRRDKRVSLPEKLTLVDVVNEGRPDPVEWFFDFWITANLQNIYGIKGHVEYIPGLIITFYRLFFLWVIFIAAKFWKKPPFAVAGLLAIFVFYLLVLLQTNYSAELVTGFQHLGIQGRYLFPVIGVMYVLVVYFLSTISGKMLSIATLALTMLLFFLGGPLVALHGALPGFLPRPVIANEGFVGEIAGPMEIAEKFTSACSGTIDQVDLLFGTFGRENHHALTVRFSDIGSGQVIMEQTIPAASIIQGPWYALPVSPAAGTFGRTYRISIFSPDSTPGDAFTIFSSKADAFPQGQALINGTPTGTDLVFRYRCVQPVLYQFIYH